MANHPNRARRSPNFTPTGAEVFALQMRLGLTDAECAWHCCVSERRWVSWVQGRELMPAGAWKLFRICVGKLSTEPPTAG